MNSCDAYYLIYDTGVSNIKLDEIIIKDCHYSYLYARYVLRGRFELGENRIVKKFHYSFSYVINVLRHNHE